MKKKIGLLIVLSFVIILILGCEGTSYQKSIYNDDDKIVKQGDSYTFGVRNGNTINNTANIKFSSFTGTDTLFTIDAKTNTTIKIDYDSKVSSGDFKIVIINPNDKIIKVIEGTQRGSVDVEILKGKNRIKIVGKGAKGTINLKINASEEVSINK